MSCRRKWIIGILTVFISILMVVLPASAEPLDEWNWMNPLPLGNTLLDIAYGNGIFVAVGGGGTILTSYNGNNWTIADTGTCNALYRIIYDNDTFVAVGGHGTILTSSDGLTWTTRMDLGVNYTSFFWDVAYGNGIFVALGGNDTVATSPDGISWTIRHPGINNPYGITHGSGKFLIISNNQNQNTVWISSDGITWASTTFSNFEGFRRITYGNNNFVALGDSYSATSPDGVNWTRSENSTIPCCFNRIVYDQGTFFALGSDGSGRSILTSLDGQTWDNNSLSSNDSLNGLAYGNGSFVAVGVAGSIFTSPNLLDWNNIRSGTSQYLFGITYGADTFVTVGYEGSILTSSDGVSWTNRISGTNQALYAVTFGNNTYVAVGDAGTVLTSSDGVTWTNRNSGTSKGLKKVTYGNGIFIAVTYGEILTSTDGVTWNIRSSGTSNDLWGIQYGNDTFVAVGFNGAVMTSPDGITWASSSADPDWDFFDVTYGNGIFVAVGSAMDQRIWTSYDGKIWTGLNSLTAQSFRNICYGNGTFVAIGPEIWTSGNGLTWTHRGCYGALDVTYGSSTFVAVGDYGCILQSGYVVSDNEAPTIFVSSPTNQHSYLKGAAINISATATDNTSVSEMAIYLDGSSTKVTSSNTGSISYAWNTSKLSEGNHTIRITATDSDNNISEENITILITLTDIEPPAITLKGLWNGCTVQQGLVNINATAEDNSGVVSGMAVYLDGNSKCARKTSNGSISYSWDTSKLSTGNHTIRITAVDPSKNMGEENITILITPDIEPPVITSGIQNGFTVAQGTPLNISATAEDNSGVVNGMAIYLDDSSRSVCKTSSGSISYSLATSNLSTGDHMIRITASDNANNTSILLISVKIIPAAAVEQQIVATLLAHQGEPGVTVYQPEIAGQSYYVFYLNGCDFNRTYDDLVSRGYRIVFLDSEYNLVKDPNIIEKLETIWKANLMLDQYKKDYATYGKGYLTQNCIDQSQAFDDYINAKAELDFLQQCMTAALSGGAKGTISSTLKYAAKDYLGSFLDPGTYAENISKIVIADMYYDYFGYVQGLDTFYDQNIQPGDDYILSYEEACNYIAMTHQASVILTVISARNTIWGMDDVNSVGGIIWDYLSGAVIDAVTLDFNKCPKWLRLKYVENFIELCNTALDTGDYFAVIDQLKSNITLFQSVKDTVDRNEALIIEDTDGLGIALNNQFK